MHLEEWRRCQRASSQSRLRTFSKQIPFFTVLVILSNFLSLKLIRLDQCCFGSPSQKPTSLLTNVESLFGWNSLCCHHRCKHVPLIGADSSGNFCTTQASEYSPSMCNGLAMASLDFLACIWHGDTHHCRKMPAVRSPPRTAGHFLAPGLAAGDTRLLLERGEGVQVLSISTRAWLALSHLGVKTAS